MGDFNSDLESALGAFFGKPQGSTGEQRYAGDSGSAGGPGPDGPDPDDSDDLGDFGNLDELAKLLGLADDDDDDDADGSGSNSALGSAPTVTSDDVAPEAFEAPSDEDVATDGFKAELSKWEEVVNTPIADRLLL